jgi:ATP-dependent Lon protease
MAEQTIVPIEQLLPNKLFLVPLTGRPIFPGIFTPVMINNPDDVKAVEDVYSGDGFVGILMIKNEVDSPTVADLTTWARSPASSRRSTSPTAG